MLLRASAAGKSFSSFLPEEATRVGPAAERSILEKRGRPVFHDELSPMIRFMTSRIPRLVILFAAAILASSSLAVEPSATTIDGRVIHCSLKQKPPWWGDVVDHVWPEYPYEARSRKWEGAAWFRLNLRSEGTVESVTLLQSTGHPLLDNFASAALLKWRFKPGRWKTIDNMILFTMHPHPQDQTSYRAGIPNDAGMRSR
jgi:TonB family protein